MEIQLMEHMIDPKNENSENLIVDGEREFLSKNVDDEVVDIQVYIYNIEQREQVEEHMRQIEEFENFIVVVEVTIVYDMQELLID